MNVLLSIKPQYVEKIKDGSKKYEFRKYLFNKNNFKKIEKVYIYSTSPIKKIVARFTIEKILENHPKYLWEKCKEFSGIEKSEFFRYFGNREKGIAIRIVDIKFFKKPIEPKSVIPNFIPPQSFCYIDDIESYNNIIEFC